MVSFFYYSKTFLTVPNKLLNFSVYELICMLFGNNNLIWKLQFRYAGLPVEVSISLGIACYCCFYYFHSFYQHCFSLGLDFLFFCKPRGVAVINGYCFVWNKIRKCIQNSFVQNKNLFIDIGIYKSSVLIKHINYLSDKISICILVVPDIAKIKQQKNNFQIKFCKNDLAMRIYCLNLLLQYYSIL